MAGEATANIGCLSWPQCGCPYDGCCTHAQERQELPALRAQLTAKEREVEWLQRQRLHLGEEINEERAEKTQIMRKWKEAADTLTTERDAALARCRELEEALREIEREASQYGDGADDAHYALNVLLELEERARQALNYGEYSKC